MKRILVAAVALAMVTSALAQRPLGAFVLGAQVTGPAGYTTNNFTVSAVGIPTIKGQIAVAYPSGQVTANDLFLTGGNGSTWFSDKNPPLTTPLIDALLGQGHSVVQIRWLNGWFSPQAGVESGFSVLAVRPATAIDYVARTFAESRGVPQQVAGCSAGGDQIAHALALYDVAKKVANAVLASGPPFAKIAEGCLQQPNYAGSLSWSQRVDVAFGGRTVVGQCVAHNPNYEATWRADSVDTLADGIYYYPTTNIHMILGQKDSWSNIVNRSLDYADVLTNHGQVVDLHIEAEMKHEIQDSVPGMNWLYAKLTGGQ